MLRATEHKPRFSHISTVNTPRSEGRLSNFRTWKWAHTGAHECTSSSIQTNGSWHPPKNSGFPWPVMQTKVGVYSTGHSTLCSASTHQPSRISVPALHPLQARLFVRLQRAFLPTTMHPQPQSQLLWIIPYMPAFLFASLLSTCLPV